MWKGKHTKSSFKPKLCSSISDPFHQLHTDLLGLVVVKSRAGKKYSLVIVNEFSRFTWVIFLCNKSDVVNEIISLIKKCEVLYDLKVKQIRSDHGTEFQNETLESFWKKMVLFKISQLLELLSKTKLINAETILSI